MISKIQLKLNDIVSLADSQAHCKNDASRFSRFGATAKRVKLQLFDLEMKVKNVDD